MSQSKIIEKMKKLLAMSESSANENEAMIATKRLHTMLAKHNISMGELNKDIEDIGEERVLTYRNPWRRLLANDIAKLYFCQFIYYGASKDKVWFAFVGSQANRTFALHIFQMIVKVIEKQARAGSRKIYGKEVSSFFNSFCNGAMNRINQRCEDLICEAKAGKLEDEEGNTLPALLSTYERIEIQLADWLSHKKIKQVTTNTTSNDPHAFDKGKEAGNRVQLSRAIQSKQSPKLLS